ncbi:MAG: hypothetical protein Q8L22_04850 [Reyranella sp.]|nr:hypothetical protein [Reyranella sp.]
MLHSRAWSLLVVGLALVGAAGSSSAQEAVRIRGTLERVDGSILIVKSRDGAEFKITVTDPPVYVALVRASVADIRPGMYVGATGLPQADGSQRAVEVHIFPEAMRGTGEGHRSSDLAPQATMTNASVEQTVTGNDGHTLTMKYKDGEKKLVVTPQTVVVTYAAGDRGELKPGTGIFISAARKMPDGTLQTPRINYGRDGLMPPM